MSVQKVNKNYSMMGVAALFVVGLFAAYWFKPPPPKKNDDVVYVYVEPKNVLHEPQ